MQIKTNIRAGAGSTNTGGQNSKKGLSTDSSAAAGLRSPGRSLRRLLSDPQRPAMRRTTAMAVHRRSCVAVSLQVVLVGCAQDPGPGFALPDTPAAFQEAGAPTAADDIPSTGEWWRVFADPTLDDLIARANRQSFTLRQAEARLAQARAFQQQAVAATWPRISGAAQATRQEGTLTNAAATTGSLFVLGVNASWELDLLNRLGREGEAAGLDVAEREALLAAARLLVQTDIARLHFLLRGIDEERVLLREVVEAQRRTARLLQGLARSGLGAELAAVRAQSEAEALATDVIALDQRRAETEQALLLVLGETASRGRVVDSAATATLPAIPPGIPGTMLARRPDMRAARQAMLAAQLRVGVARDAWLPAITLNGFAGLAAASAPAVFAASAASSGLGALASLPIVDGGRYKANAARAIADRDLAAATYGQQILLACKEVEEQLAGLRLLAEQEAVAGQAAAASGRMRALVMSNRASGLASQLEVLDAERSALRDRRKLVQLRAARFAATVVLVRALGGGWSDAPKRLAMDGR